MIKFSSQENLLEKLDPVFGLFCSDCRELETAREAQAQNEGKLAEAQRVAEQEKASALERQKRFNLLNNQFKRKEIAFAKDLQTVQEKAETSERTVISLQAECRSIQQVCLSTRNPDALLSSSANPGNRKAKSLEMVSGGRLHFGRQALCFELKSKT